MIDQDVLVPRGKNDTIDFHVAPPADWPEWRKTELVANTRNGRVGAILVSESHRARVWSIWLQPGERLPFHRHVLDYFWTTTSAGKSRSWYDDGRVTETEYKLGETRHYKVEKGGSFMHDLENIGDTVLGYITVEYLDSANPPLDVSR